MDQIKVALIGAGQRGKDVYGEFALLNSNKISFEAVVETNKQKREQFIKKHSLDPSRAYGDWNSFFNDALESIDAVVIATPDHLHYEPAKKSLEMGYHVLLEKPMSNDVNETYKLGELARKNNRIFMICHVLRYTPFFKKIKGIIDSGIIGDVMSIQHNENIGYFHMAHSFVRGNWRNTEESSPIILAKSCHDMDILHYLVGSKAKAIASYGMLSHFKSDQRPENAAPRCKECPLKETCIYSAYGIYLDNIGRWPTTVIADTQNEASVLEAIAKGPYGRCVYSCDNDVCDHQVTSIAFENGITATFNLSAFTNKVHRTIKIMGTKGEIHGNDAINEVTVDIFGESKKEVYTPKVVSGGHGGGDHEMMLDFINLISKGSGEALTAADKSVHSHLMSFAAERSRVNEKVIILDDYIEEFLK